MNYQLNQDADTKKNTASSWSAISSLLHFLDTEKMILVYAAGVTVINSGVTLLAPLIIAYVIDTYIVTKEFSGVLTYGAILLALYTLAMVTSYLQTRLMGGVGQRVLFKLRDSLFHKIQSLPVAFFDANKTGDLISRINNDTDKLNQFFSQTLVRFFSSAIIMFGAAVFMLVLDFKLAIAALLPALLLIVFAQIVSPWIKNANAQAARATGNLSAEISESLSNFKAVVAFNQRGFFTDTFAAANETNYRKAILAGVANNTFSPVFQFAANGAQLIVLAYGIYLISNDALSIGLLIGFLSYVSSFYDPLRQLAGLWANLQVALASWNRISVILVLKNTMLSLSGTVSNSKVQSDAPALEFKAVSFGYTKDTAVLSNISLQLEAGKTYALVGPTGGGKTTTALLMARLYDPTSGQVLLDGRDIREYSDTQRTQRISFILQEPILFSGTIKENILYGNQEYADYSDEAFLALVHERGLEGLLNRFEAGLQTKVDNESGSISLGQKQIITFMRSILRRPDILILDEATANIDTVTEQILEEVLEKLPATTTRVIIAHRLNTIEDADEIFFVNSGQIVHAGSMNEALELLEAGVRGS
jgi:ATP-binding cassette subfamily B protein